MSIDWDLILGTNLDQLDDERAELLYDQLIEYMPDNENRVDHLKRLFVVSKSVMQVKALQADVAIEELEEMVKNRNRYDNNEFEMIKKQLEVYKQLDMSGNDMSQVAGKLNDANKEVAQLRNSLEHKESEIIKFKRRVNELENSVEVKDKEILSLRSEVDSLKEDIDGQRQFDERIAEKQEPIEKLREKNKQIQSLLDELKDMEIVNMELAKQVKHLKMQLTSVTNELNLNCNEMEMMKEQRTQIEELNEEFVKQKAFLESEILILREKLENHKNEDEKIAGKFSEKIEKLQKIMQEKDEEILHLRTMSHASGLNSVGNEYKMNREIEKDKQIELLKSQLSDAVGEIESQIETMQRMKHDQDANQKESYIAILKEQIECLNQKLKEDEVEAQVKDEELNSLRKRINAYETGEYGLSEAVREVNELTQLIIIKDNKIEELIQQINQLKIQFDDALEEIDALRESGGQTSPGLTKIVKRTEANTKQRQSSDKLEKLEMQQQLLKLEEEKIELMEELRALKGGKSMKKVKDMNEVVRLSAQLKDIERENRDLHLGIKEILRSITESDARSDTIIECPTLTRLCQLLEGRSLSSDLTNVIALKAELDLVRGHNEQLRMEMKRLRKDHIILIKQYTQDLLDGDSMGMKEEHVANVESSKEQSNKENEATKGENDINLKEDELIKLLDKSTQTQALEIMREEEKHIEEDERSKESVIEFEIRKVLLECETQTEQVSQVSFKCKKCEKVTNIIASLKNCVDKLQENMKLSEENYAKQITLLQTENRNLSENYDLKLKEKEDTIRRKEEHIRDLESRTQRASSQLSLQKYEPVHVDVQIQQHQRDREQQLDAQQNQLKVSSSCTSVLETVINCLQARIDHKDESIKQYRNMLQEVKQNFENEMIRLIESNQTDGRISDRLDEMIDNEELQNALQNCLAELESSKLELNARISQLESELEQVNQQNQLLKTENETLKQKRINPNLNLKREIELLKEQCLEKENIIANLNKTLKDERNLRTVSSPVKRTKQSNESRIKSAKKEETDNLSELINENEKLKTRIKEMEVNKWELEKRMKEMSEHNKVKMRDKANEIAILEKNYEKAKTLVNKNENEIHSLHEKISKISFVPKKNLMNNKWTQCCLEEEGRKTEAELKKITLEKKNLETRIEEANLKLEKQLEKENELKILLQESLQREKMATIYEEKIDLDKHCEKLLQENAQIKVELRMAEFELRRKGR